MKPTLCLTTVRIGLCDTNVEISRYMYVVVNKGIEIQIVCFLITCNHGVKVTAVLVNSLTFILIGCPHLSAQLER